MVHSEDQELVFESDEEIEPSQQSTFVDEELEKQKARNLENQEPDPGEIHFDPESSGISGEQLGDCAPITEASIYWDVCEVDVGYCAGVFRDGQGCAEYCGAAGLECSASFSVSDGCERGMESLDCVESDEFQAAWCECVPGALACEASCAGKVCGPDGCGGQCGECAAGHICEDGGCAYVEDGGLLNGPSDEPQCGDDTCEGMETTANCVDDCGSLCGDGVCNGVEDSSNCASDCVQLSTPDPDGEVLGYVDGTSASDGIGSVSGWACHLGWAGSIDVHLYVGGPAGQGIMVKAITAANPSEAAVGEACQDPVGAHRYEFHLTADELSAHQGKAIYVHGISPVGIGNLLLMNSGDFVVPAVGGGEVVEDPAPEPTPEPEVEIVPEPIDEGPPADFAGVTWLHTNVSGWAETATLSAVSFKGGNVCMPYDKANVWPITTIGAENTEIVGNPWIFIKKGGKWYAATWEWLRPGQTCKASKSVAGDHIKQPPFAANSGWKPTSGQAYWFMVSAPARMGQMTVAERSNLVKVIWP